MRGVPHCHLVCCLHPDDKIKSDIDKIDQMIWAEIPIDYDSKELDTYIKEWRDVDKNRTHRWKKNDPVTFVFNEKFCHLKFENDQNNDGKMNNVIQIGQKRLVLWDILDDDGNIIDQKSYEGTVISPKLNDNGEEGFMLNFEDGDFFVSTSQLLKSPIKEDKVKITFGHFNHC